MPPHLDQLTSLRILELNNNQICGLPPQIGDLLDLRKLLLHHNKLPVLPYEIGHLPKLALLRLDHNPVKNIPIEEYQKGTANTLEYLRNAGPGIETGGELKTFVFVREFSDVVFLVGPSTFYAHRAVFCARSPVLRALLHSLPDHHQHHQQPGNDGDHGGEKVMAEIRPPEELSDIEPSVFAEFIRYLYCDGVDKERLKEVHENLSRVAFYYGVERLYEMCRRLTVGYVIMRESTFIQDFEVLMEEPTRFSDVSFMVEGEAIRAHKVFLAASSSYFRGMFTSGLKEAHEDEIALPHLRADIFRLVREYCYTGDVQEITGDTAVDLLAASCAFALPRLKSIVESLLGYSLDVDSVACLYSVAVLYEADVLERACEFFMAANLRPVIGTSAWRELPPHLQARARDNIAKWRKSGTS